MSDGQNETPRTSRPDEQVKDLPKKELDEADAEQVKGGVKSGWDVKTNQKV